MKTLSALVAAAALATSLHSGVAMADHSPSHSSLVEGPSAGAMAFDLLAVRPLGLASLIIGSGLFVLQLPFDVFVDDGVRVPFEKLVADPARFTFTRPLGSSE